MRQSGQQVGREGDRGRAVWLSYVAAVQVRLALRWVRAVLTNERDESGCRGDCVRWQRRRRALDHHAPLSSVAVIADRTLPNRSCKPPHPGLPCTFQLRARGRATGQPIPSAGPLSPFFAAGPITELSLRSSQDSCGTQLARNVFVTPCT